MKRYLGSLAASLSLLIAATGSVALLIGGCGSASRTVPVLDSASALSDRSAVGSASLQIQWPLRRAASPAKGRLVPVASNTLLVQITFQGRIIATAVVPRPSGPNPVSTLSFPSLPVGQLGVSAFAVPDTTIASPTAKPTDAQASGNGTLNIQSNKQTVLGITLKTTIVSLVIVPVPQSGTDFIQTGATQTFNVQALDSNGATVAISPQTIQWSIPNPGVILTMTPHSGDTGVDITGNLSGDTTLFVLETESNQQASLQVSVRGPLAALKITTVLPSANVGGIVQFGYVGTDAAGFVIPGSALPNVQWSSSDPSVASIGAASGQCTANSTGSSQGTTTKTAFITLKSGSFQDVQIITVNSGQETLGAQLSPVTVFLGPNISQTFLSWTYSPVTGLTVPRGIRYAIVIPVGANGGPAAFGTLFSNPQNGSCVYTAPPVHPTVTSNGITSTVTAVQIQASNGAPPVTVTLQ